MTQEQLVKEFLSGATGGICGGAGNLKILDNKLIHYQTVIAERVDGKVFLNMTRYSVVTGRIQKMVQTSVEQDNLVEVKRVQEGYKNSLQNFSDYTYSMVKK